MTAKTKPPQSTSTPGRTAREFARRLAARWKKAFGLVSGCMLTVEIAPGSPLEQALPGLRVQPLGVEDGDQLAALAQVYEVPASEGGLRSWLAKGELLYLARLEGQIAGYLWLRPSGTVVEFGKALLPLAADEVYCHDVFVLPAMRGKGIYPQLLAVAGRALAESSGKRHILMFVETRNHASLRAAYKLGARHAGRVGCLKLFGRKFPFLWRHAPRSR